MEGLLRDLGFAWRGLRRSPGFSAAAVLTLALGIGANTAIFSWIDGLLLRPLPWPRADRLMQVWQTRLDDDGHAASPANFFDWRHARSFQALAAYDTRARTLRPRGIPDAVDEPARVQAATVSANFFAVIGIHPWLGRTFGAAAARRGALAEDRSRQAPQPALAAAAAVLAAKGADLGGTRDSRQVVLGYGLWHRRFAASPAVIGAMAELEGEPYRVVGVMPRGMAFPDGAELWVLAPHDVPDLPFPDPGDVAAIRDAFYFSVIGRLAAHASPAAAQAEMDAIAGRLAHDYPQADAHCGIRLVPLREALVGGGRKTLLLLLGAVGCVLLIACVNVANLLLARAAGRQKEIAMRAALGASRGRLILQLSTEAALIALLGGGAGLLLALPAARLEIVRVPAELAAAATPQGPAAPRHAGTPAAGDRLSPRPPLPAPPHHAGAPDTAGALDEAGTPDAADVADATGAARQAAGALLRPTAPRVLGFTLALILLAALLAGMAPALAAARTPFVSGLRGGGMATAAGPRGGRSRGLLVVSEVGLALVLLAGAALSLGGLWRLQRMDAGFEAAHVLALRVSLPGAGRMPARRWQLTYERLLDGLAALPGVESAGAVLALPLTGPSWGAGLRVAGRAFGPREAPAVCWRLVSPGYMRTLGIPLLRGRAFSSADRRGAEPVALINAALARLLWPRADPIGQRIATGLDGPAGTWLRIVGVAGDTPQESLALPARPEIYRPLDQDSRFDGGAMQLVLRAAGDPIALAAAARSRVRELDPDAALSDLGPLDRLRSLSTARPRQAGGLLALAATVALLLAAVGLYGVLSHLVQQRRHELGVRAALGASERQLVALVMGSALRLVAVGALLGAAGSLVLTRLLGALLYELATGAGPALRPDPIAPLAVALLVLGVTAALASYLPASRAAHLDPLAVLRDG